MADLTWFQYDVDWWEERVREFRLTYEEEGILMRLIRPAWRAKVPCTIEDSEDEFARILGARWKRGLPVIRAHFLPDPEAPGRLRCAWLSGVYVLALSKHESYQNRGKLGGRPKRRSGSSGKAEVSNTLSSGSETENLNLGSASDSLARKNKAEGFSCGPTDHTTKTPALESARSAETPRAPDADGRTSILDTQQRAIADEYQRRLYDHADRWRAESDAHRAQWQEFEALERRAVGRPALTCDAMRSGSMIAQTLYHGVVERVRAQEQWPNRDEWAKAKARTLPEIVGAA